MIRRITLILLSFFCIINAQIALPTFQAVHKPHASPYESGSQTFNYTGAEQTFTVPSGVSTITIKAWGAQGGGEPADGTWGDGGKGGYSTGDASVSSGSTIYIIVGQQGFSTHSSYAYNGGGGGTNTQGSVTEEGFSGGGATHVAKISGILSTLSGNVSNILIVAGGGGGAGGSQRDTWPQYIADGGAGGGSSGIDGPDGGTTSRPGGDRGTQSAGGSGTANSVSSSFGLGARSDDGTTNWIQGGGGGGGYYGGGAGDHDGGGGGGGSGYIGGVTNSPETIAGNATMPNPDGGTMTGRTGNGLVVISW